MVAVVVVVDQNPIKQVVLTGLYSKTALSHMVFGIFKFVYIRVNKFHNCSSGLLNDFRGNQECVYIGNNSTMHAVCNQSRNEGFIYNYL